MEEAPAVFPRQPLDDRRVRGHEQARLKSDVAALCLPRQHLPFTAG